VASNDFSDHSEGVEVLQGVLVLDVAVEGADVLVDVYGSTSHVCGSVRFTFENAKRRRTMADLLRRWAREGTPVTYIRTGSTIALQNDAAVFGSQLESAQ